MVSSYYAKARIIPFMLIGRRGKTSAIPRHSEINEFLARKICRDLAVPEP
jgi:hypothetical protein